MAIYDQARGRGCDSNDNFSLKRAPLVMKTTLDVITRNDDRYREASVEILQDAIGQGFESVFVLGLKDGRIFFLTSPYRSKLELIGAIELAKQHLWLDE